MEQFQNRCKVFPPPGPCQNLCHRFLSWLAYIITSLLSDSLHFPIAVAFLDLLDSSQKLCGFEGEPESDEGQREHGLDKPREEGSRRALDGAHGASSLELLVQCRKIAFVLK